MPAVSSTRPGANVACLAAWHPERRPAITQTEPKTALVGKRASRQETNQVNPAKKKNKQKQQPNPANRVKMNKTQAETKVLIKRFSG